MSGFLNPQVNPQAQTLTVGTMMQQPARITERISRLAADQIILDKIFHTTGQKVTGGAMLFNVVNIEDFFTENDVEQRAPGTEYPIVRGVDPKPQTAPVEDWGGKFWIDDLKITRNATEFMNDQTTQLTNTIVETLNTRAIASLEAALAAQPGGNVVVGHDWASAVTIGPDANLTEGAELPAADIAAAQLVGENMRMGVKYDTLLLNPNELHSLRICYGDKLTAMLASVGIKEHFSYPLIAPGTAYVVVRGQAGIIGFEHPLDTETWRDPHKRISWVQSWCQPAWAVNKPFNCIKLTGLAGV